jgi:glycosyltransferase involved in cell wall biosynthesis
VSSRRRAFLDLQTVQSRGFFERGIPRYATQLCLELLRSGSPIAGFGLNPTQPFPRHLPPELAHAPQLRWNTAATLRDAQHDGPILYHLMSPFERPDLRSSALPSHVLGTGIPIVCTVYDLIPDMAGLFEPGSRDERFHRIRNRVLGDADLLLALSDRTREDVIEHLGVDPDRIVVVGAAASDFFRPPVDGERPAQLVEHELRKVTRPFLLTVSAWAPHKNTELAIEAFAALPGDLRASLQLVVACTLPAEGLVHWEAHAADAGLAGDEVVFTGFVPDPVLRALYQTTQLCVYPSRYEGFGLPVLEAARCGSPAITSNCPPLPDVLDWAPGTFDPDDAGALAGLIARSVTDKEFRARLHDVAAAAVHRHTWDRVAQRTLRAYERVDTPTTRRRARRPLRAALVGPFPPVRSGIAHYNLELANRLVDRCTLDCFFDACDWVHDDIRHEMPADRVQSVGSRRSPGSQARWFAARALGRSMDPARYDAVIYSIGDSWFQHDTLAVARRYPGIVWFHDVDLVGLYITYAHRLLENDAPAAAALFREVLARYGNRAPDLAVTLSDRRWANYEPYRRSGLRLALELASDAHTNIVTSQLARKLLQFDAGPLAPLAPIEVLPLAPPRWASPAQRAETDPPVVVSLGRQEDAKPLEMLIDAIAIVKRVRPARLAIVGEIRPEQRARLQRRVEVLRLGGIVEVTGFVTDHEYRNWINRAVCAVQLRAYGTGEGSAAVAHAVGAGLPVISNIPSCLELPDGTLQRITDTATAESIAAEIQLLLDHADRRARLREGALRYARSWSVDDVAARLLEIAERNLSPESAFVAQQRVPA